MRSLVNRFAQKWEIFVDVPKRSLGQAASVVACAVKKNDLPETRMGILRKAREEVAVIAGEWHRDAMYAGLQSPDPSDRGMARLMLFCFSGNSTRRKSPKIKRIIFAGTIRMDPDNDLVSPCIRWHDGHPRREWCCLKNQWQPGDFLAAVVYIGWGLK